MIIFGLTGGVASGKSTVARLFASWGVPVVDADQVARDVVAPGSAALSEIVSEFGTCVLAADGSLDRSALAQIVFTDAARRAQLNAIVHPRVREEVERKWAQMAANGHMWACYDVPLLFETQQHMHYRPVIVVSCPDHLRLERMMARDGLTFDQAQARLASQMPQSEKVAQADILIVNDGDRAHLEDNARAALDQVRSQLEQKGT